MGLWWAGWIVGVAVASARLIRWSGAHPDAVAGLLDSATNVLRAMARLVHLPAPAGATSVAAVFLAVGVLAGALLGWLIQIIRLDPDLLVLRSGWWMLRALAGRSGALLVLLTPPVLVITSLFLEALWGSVDAVFWLLIPLLAASLAWAVVVPFAVVRNDVLQQPSEPTWWRPRWPGLSVVAAVVGLEVLDHGIDELMTLATPDPFGQVGVPLLILLPALWCLGSVVGLGIWWVQIGLLFGRRPLLTWSARLLRWRTFGPWLAQSALELGVLVVLIAPVPPLYFWLWKVVPLAASAAEGHGTALHGATLVAVGLCKLGGRFWWLGVLAAAGLTSTLSWLWRGRLAWLLSQPAADRS